MIALSAGRQEESNWVKKSRTDPVQAEIVRLVKSSPLGLVTAAIGDGGNDVSMIQVLLSSLLPLQSSAGGSRRSGHHRPGGQGRCTGCRLCFYKV